MGLPVVHFEMMSKDPAGVSDFYASVFGWKVRNHPEVNYRVFETGSETGSETGIGGGIVKPDRDGLWKRK
jgi:hypothetical protein